MYVANGGNDTLDISFGSTAGDKIRLLGNRVDVSYARSGNDLVITYDGGQMTLIDYGYDETTYNAITIKTNDAEFTLGSAVGTLNMSALTQSTLAWQTAGADSDIANVFVDNPEDVNLMQVYTNNA